MLPKRMEKKKTFQDNNSKLDLPECHALSKKKKKKLKRHMKKTSI